MSTARAESTPVAGKADTNGAGRLRSLIAGTAYKLYKVLISPVLHAVAPSRCMYQPTCSEYAYIAVSRFGVLRGSWMAARRLARCHPWAKGGLDAVPMVSDPRSSLEYDSPTTGSNP